MKIRWIKTEDTPHRHVDAGTVADADDELAKQLIDEGTAEPVVEKTERAAKPEAKKATKK